MGSGDSGTGYYRYAVFTANAATQLGDIIGGRSDLRNLTFALSYTSYATTRFIPRYPT